MQRLGPFLVSREGEKSLTNWYHDPVPRLETWLTRARAELSELLQDARELWRAHVERIRNDPSFRRALAEGLLRGLLSALSRGPRATVLWVVILALEVILEAIRALQDLDHGNDYDGLAFD